MKTGRCDFGSKIRLVRERKGFTLKEVAQKAGVSESLVSQIERDKVSPSIDTLMALADVLEMDAEYLFRDFRKPRRAKIVKKEEQNLLLFDGVSYRQIAFQPESPGTPSMEMLELEIPPGKEKGDQEYGHAGLEMGFIVQGEGLLVYGDQESPLSVGDSVSFLSNIPHTIKCTGAESLKAIWVISPGRIFK